ncbi:3-hydroxyanthranilic acid dioxygenase [Lambiella insularis]|nr:3-hydroxyanthranilic acid dioxygenase [Lambiella insularis]
MLSNPLNLPKWCFTLEENSHLLKPPINNYCVYDKDVTVMVITLGLPSTLDLLLTLSKIVGGPNARTDYHINTTAEWFYQYRGSMLLKVVDAEHTPQHRDIPIREGEMFLLPPNTPHNPIRFADTVGIVLEQPRPANSVDTLRWYCQSCGEVVHEASFHLTDLGTQIKEAVNAFKADEAKRKCENCGELADVVPRNVVQP